MGKKRRRKSSKNKVFQRIGAFFSGLFAFILKILPPAFVVGVVILSFLGVRSALYADTHLAVQQIVVEPEDSYANSIKETLSARYVGTNILKIDLEKVAGQIKKNSNIKRVEVHRDFPHTLKVKFINRVPVAVVQFKQGGSYAVISEDGVILSISHSVDPSKLVIRAHDYSGGKIKVGERVRFRGFQRAVDFIEAYWAKPLVDQDPLVFVQVDYLGSISIGFQDGLIIHLGKNPSGRLQALRKITPLLQGPERTGIEYIDLQYDDVIVKKRGS